MPEIPMEEIDSALTQLYASQELAQQKPDHMLFARKTAEADVRLSEISAKLLPEMGPTLYDFLSYRIGELFPGTEVTKEIQAEFHLDYETFAEARRLAIELTTVEIEERLDEYTLYRQIDGPTFHGGQVERALTIEYAKRANEPVMAQGEGGPARLYVADREATSSAPHSAITRGNESAHVVPLNPEMGI
jgi:hypothetical protein